MREWRIVGAVGDLLCAIEDGCALLNSARGELDLLKPCQATLRPVKAGASSAV